MERPVDFLRNSRGSCFGLTPTLHIKMSSDATEIAESAAITAYLSWTIVEKTVMW